jgi:hypothetical protein
VHPLIFLYSVGLLLTLLILAGTGGAAPVAPGGSTLPSFPAPESGIGAVEDAAAHPQVVSIVPEVPGTSTGCANATLTNPYPEAVEGNLAFDGNLFNLPAGALGSTSLCYNAGAATLSDTTQFTSLPGAVLHGVLGYPEAILGQNLWGGDAGQAPGHLPLPADRFSNLTSRAVWAHLTYAVKAPGKSPYDFAFDDWFSEDQAGPSSTGNVGNRIEVMIWLSNDIGMYLPQTQVSIPSYFNGSANPGTWYRDTLCQSSDFVTFDYLFAPTGSKPGYGAASGRIAFDLTSILNNVAEVMYHGTCWAAPGTHIGSLWADNFPIGAEFYPTTSSTASVSWSISSFYYRVF